MIKLYLKARFKVLQLKDRDSEIRLWRVRLTTKSPPRYQKYTRLGVFVPIQTAFVFRLDYQTKESISSPTHAFRRNQAHLELPEKGILGLI
jgi:hypothetical protein